MNVDQLIEVLQGMKQGRKAQYEFACGWIFADDLADVLRVCKTRNIRLEPLPDEIMFNGVLISAPLRVAPKKGTKLYVAGANYPQFWFPLGKFNPSEDEHAALIQRGLLHLTPESAAKHGRAMTIEGRRD